MGNPQEGHTKCVRAMETRERPMADTWQTHG